MACRELPPDLLIALQLRQATRMHPDLEKLLALQQADAEIARLSEEVAALPKRVTEIETKLHDAQTGVETAKAAIKADELARRKHEADISSLQQKISKLREQQLGVKTNDQYKALVHEIDFAEKEIREHEDKILEAMVEVENLERQVKAAESELKAQAAVVEKEKSEARARTDEDNDLLAGWREKRTALRAEVGADLLSHYDRVLRLRKTALAEVRDHKCMACQVMLRPQTYNEVRSNEQVLTCDSCQRILYFDSSREAAPAPVEEAASSPAVG